MERKRKKWNCKQKQENKFKVREGNRNKMRWVEDKFFPSKRYKNEEPKDIKYEEEEKENGTQGQNRKQEIGKEE